ncbi:adenylate kinase family enzyme [Sporosarcina luteola]|nr:adenylate kinase family enzyme [Sporosarcina luteola]
MKLFIMGIVASGKTTYAKKLSTEMDLPFVELDAVVYHEKDGQRVKRSPEKQMEVIREIDQAGGWIMEGVYRPSYHKLIEMADAIIWLDPPLYKRRYRILSRHMKQVIGLESCAYKPDFQMLRNMYKWTEDFERKRPVLEEYLKPHRRKVISVKGDPWLDKELNQLFKGRYV